MIAHETRLRSVREYQCDDSPWPWRQRCVMMEFLRTQNICVSKDQNVIAEFEGMLLRTARGESEELKSPSQRRTGRVNRPPLLNDQWGVFCFRVQGRQTEQRRLRKKISRRQNEASKEKWTQYWTTEALILGFQAL